MPQKTAGELRPRGTIPTHSTGSRHHPREIQRFVFVATAAVVVSGWRDPPVPAGFRAYLGRTARRLDPLQSIGDPQLLSARRADVRLAWR